MLAVFYGDKVEARSKAVAAIIKKLPAPVALQALSGTDITRERIKEALANTSLFGGSTIVTIAFPFSEGTHGDDIIALLPDIQTSETTCIIIEPSLSKDQIKSFKKYADSMEGFESTTLKKAPRFNTFLFADAIGNKDKKKLWILLEQSRKEGIAAEEIHGILFWQLKTMMIIAKEKGMGAAELDINPFVYRKAQGFLKLYKDDELARTTSNLVASLYAGRRSGQDGMFALEKFILSAF